MFVMMSGKRRRDYKKVLEAVLRALPDDPAVVLDLSPFWLSPFWLSPFWICRRYDQYPWCRPLFLRNSEFTREIFALFELLYFLICELLCSVS